MINRAVLVGRLTRDSELRYTSSGVAVASFTVAINRQFTNSNNEREADFINCVIWRKAAENFTNFTHKGSLVGIDGHIQTRTYENQQGQRIYVTEVVTDNFSLLESRDSNNNGADNNANKASNTNGYGNQHADRRADTSNDSKDSQKKSNDPFKDNSQPIDVSDDDLPF